jgi:hypothetical protein
MATCDAPKSSPLPPLFNAWMEELLGGSLPEETHATCSNCAMLPQPGESRSEEKIFFDPHSKCCTYLPNIPNFLVGRVFRDHSPEMATGRATMEKRLAARVSVTPLGIGQPSSYLLWYNHSKSFGRSQTLRCPHYIEDGGRCSIWRHREGTCATWFCKHDRGAAGQRFWRDAVHRLLKAVEGALAQWCVMELDLGSTALERVLTLSDDFNTIKEGELEGQVKAADYRALWGRWDGKEREFYETCAARVDGFKWSDVARICGPRVALLARLTQDVFAQLARTTPEAALRCGSFHLVSLRANVARLSTYNDYDPVEISAPLLNLLQHFQGQPTSEAIADISKLAGVNVAPELVRKLTDFGLLVPANAPDAAPTTADSNIPSNPGGYANAPTSPSKPSTKRRK